MKKLEMKITLIWAMILLGKCVSYRRRTDTIQKFHRTGEAIAIDNLIQKYEREHIKFYEEETNGEEYLRWPVLDNKNLSNYCNKYLNQTIPTKPTDAITGTKMSKTLYYGKGNTSTTSKIVVLQCKIKYKAYQFLYYLTRARETNCVYTLKSKGCRIDFILTIINKYCDFEDKPLIKRPLKRKRTENIFGIHRNTWQPIAKDEYLMAYELEHQQLVKREGNNDKFIEWPHAMVHPNLNSYCSQYLEKSALNKKREGIKGRWKTENFQYQKLNINECITVITIRCQPVNVSKVHYYVTRALESNCVYALLRKSHNAFSPFTIIYKHCDFEESNDQDTIPQHYEFHDKVVIPKTEVKEERFDTLETLQLFPED